MASRSSAWTPTPVTAADTAHDGEAGQRIASYDPGVSGAREAREAWQGYAKSVAQYDDQYALIDEVLYGVCARYPNHKSRRQINAKVWIIGRTYQTGLERKVKASGRQGSALDIATAHMHKNRVVIDEAIDELRELREPLDARSIETIVRVHGVVNRVVSRVRIGRHSARSFVAKYLHFHCPIVPIYDRFAVQSLKRLVRWRRSLDVIPGIKQADFQYRRYALRFLHLYTLMRAAGLQPEPTVRRLDRFLVEADRQT